MTDAEFARQLLSAYRTEQFGQALYLSLARFSRDPLRRQKWQHLAALEGLTQRRLASALQAAAVALPGGRGMSIGGWLAGLLMAALPWSLAMVLLQAGAKPALRSLQVLANRAVGRDAALLDYLLGHERVQLDFVAHELAGRPAQSMSGVLALLAEAGLLPD